MLSLSDPAHPPRHTALLAEGGGMRGVFGTGILDAFLEADFDPFDLYMGVSAGANNLSSFIARQHRRSYRIYAELGTRPDFVNLAKYLRGGHYMDLDWLWAASAEQFPLDLGTALKHLSRREFLVVASDLETGKPLYLQPRRTTWEACLKASSAVPIAYRGPYKLNGHVVTDGGVVDPLPVKEAYRRGARRMVIIRSRPLDCVAGFSLEPYFLQAAFRRYPKMRGVTRRQNAIYAEALDFVTNPPEDVSIVQIAPTRPLKTRRTSRDASAMKEDYELGRSLGHETVRALAEDPVWSG